MQDEMWNTFKMVSAIATAIFLNVDMMWENAVFVTKNAKSSNWEMELAIVLQTVTARYELFYSCIFSFSIISPSFMKSRQIGSS